MIVLRQNPWWKISYMGWDSSGLWTACRQDYALVSQKSYGAWGLNSCSSCVLRRVCFMFPPGNHRNWNLSRNDYYPGRQPSYFFFFSTLDSLLYFLSWHKTIFWMSFTRTMVSLEIKLVTPALTATKITCNKHISYPVVQPRSQGSLLPTLRTP